MRRTIGWDKIEDRISLSQFKNGIKKRDGSWTERGTGLKKDETIINANRKLEELGFINIRKQGRKIRIYVLRLPTESEAITNQNGEIATPKNGDTITTRSKPFKQQVIYLKNPKAYYNGNRLYKTDYGKWKLIPKEGGAHQDFVGHEWEIE